MLQKNEMGISILKSWIDGKYYEEKPNAVTTINSPWDNRPAVQYHMGGDIAVDAAVESARLAYLKNRKSSAMARKEWLSKAADEVEKAAEDIVTSAIRAIGKPRRAAKFEAMRSAQFIRLCAEEIGHLWGDTIPLDTTAPGIGHFGFTRRVAYGVIGAITPFNAPANLLVQKVAPAIAMGNAVVVKPSYEGAEIALIVAECFSRAGVPDGLFNVVVGRREEATAIAVHQDVPVLTITGGNAAADALGSAAKAKPLFSELGGNSANIVLADADLEEAAGKIAASAFEASGQQCISAQRIIVEQSVFDAFLTHFTKAAQKLTVGDPDKSETDVGPMINVQAAKRVEQMIKDAVASGATLACGGTRDNAVVAPTIVVNPASNSSIVCNEVFGPVAAVIAAKDVDDAIDIANRSEYGLQAACFTNNLNHALKITEEVVSGSIWVNEASRFRLDCYPFGGMGASGFGREGVRYAMEEYSQWKFTGMRLPS